VPAKRVKDLRTRLLDEALDQIRTEGAHHVSLRSIAKAAGCSPMATYRHFPSKEALLAEIACDGFIELRKEIDAVVSEFPDDPIRQLEEVGNRYIRLALKKPQHLLTMFGSFIEKPHSYAQLDEKGRTAFGGLVEVIVRCQKVGKIPAGDPIEKAVAAWSMVHGFSMLLLNGNLDFLGIDLKNYDRFASMVSRAALEGLLRQK
jgi:AcrR family transcriptional regulator